MTDHLSPDIEPQLTFPRPNYRDHFITGTPAQLAAIWNNHRQAGTLITWLKPRLLDDGSYQMMLRLRTAPPDTRPQATRPAQVSVAAPSAYQRPRLFGRKAVIVTAIAGTIAGLLAAVAYLLGKLVELITAHAALILGVLALAAIIAAATARRSSGRRHCPGC
jgi:hypothetical protein